MLFRTTLLLSILLLFTYCEKEDQDENNNGGGGNGYAEPTELPSVQINPLTDGFISASNVFLSAAITDDGGGAIIQKGFCWSTSPDPDIEDSHTLDVSGDDNFWKRIHELVPEETYYARAFAENALGLSYSNSVSFTTKSLADLEQGELYGGGIVLYSDGSGGGLIIAEHDIPVNDSLPWGCMGTEIGNTSQSPGTGANNTQRIVDGCPDVGAARASANLELNGYDDWYLPSRNELYMMHELFQLNIGNFRAGKYYWSSSELNENSAWATNIQARHEIFEPKDKLLYVRPIRSF